MLFSIRSLLLLFFAAHAAARVVQVIVSREMGIESGNWSYTPPSVCNGDGAVRTNAIGDLISRNFNGTSISALFIKANNGSMARIELDGVFQESVDLFDPSTTYTTCNTLKWTSGVLPYGAHSLKVSHFGNSAQAGAPLISTMYITQFEYTVPDDLSSSSSIFASSTSSSTPVLVSVPTSSITPSADTASQTPNPNPTSHSKSNNAGAIAGGVIGGVVALFAIALLIWWLRKRRTHSNHTEQANPDLIEDGKPAQSPWLVAGGGTNALPFDPSTPYQDMPSPSSPQRGEVAMPWSPTSPGSTVYGGASTYPTVSPPSPTITPPNRTSSPAYSMPSSVGNRLSRQQLDMVQNLAAQNVPGPTIAAIVDSMLADPNYDPTPRQPEAAPAYRDVK